MANDQPFVELPSPPRSPSQDSRSQDIRGNDFGPTVNDDDGLRARAYAAHLLAMARNKRDMVLKLKGSATAFRSLWHKTAPLTDGVPPYVDSDL